MKQKIFWIEIVTTIISLIILFIVSLLYIKNQNYDNAKSELNSYIQIASEVFDGTNFEETKRIVTKGNTKIRITIIDQEGEVAIDSSFSSAQNHIDREELQKLGEYVIRYSNSLKVNMMYLAQLDDGYYLRLAIPIESVNAFVYNYLGSGLITLLVISAISIIVTALLFKKTLKPITKEINKLESVLGNDLSKDTTFEHLSSKINDLTKELNEKISSLSNEKEKTQFILDHMNQGLILLNQDGKIELINQYCLTILGFEQSFLEDKNYMYLFRDISSQELISDCLQTKKENQTIYAINNKRYLLSINILENTWFDASKFLAAILVVDITLQDSINSLKREFFANASHELKSPLTSIIGYQQLIQQGMLVSPEEIKDATQRTIKEAQRMNKLIGEMLDLSRLENNVKTSFEKVDIGKTVSDCLSSLNPQIDKKNITIECAIENSTMMASQTDLYKLIKNILENAIIYNNDGGKITIKFANNTFKVVDTGIGIAKEDIEHIFDRFYRVDKARSKESSGTGLGLSIVKHICLLYGYQIDVQSTLGKGTIFTIIFTDNQ